MKPKRRIDPLSQGPRRAGECARAGVSTLDIGRESEQTV